jgi:hypothetical protein
MLQLFARYFIEKPPTAATRLLCTSLLSKQNDAELEAKDGASSPSDAQPHERAAWRGASGHDHGHLLVGSSTQTVSDGRWKSSAGAAWLTAWWLQMANKHEAREPSTKPVVWARSEPDTARFYAGPGRSARISGPGSDRKLGTVG